MSRVVVTVALLFVPACGPTNPRGPAAPIARADTTLSADAPGPSESEIPHRAAIEALVAARTRAIAAHDWGGYAAIIHPDAVAEATAVIATDREAAMRTMLMKSHEVADGVVPGDTAVPEVGVLGVVREGDRLHALVGAAEGVPGIVSFRSYQGRWMLDIPPELAPFVPARPAELPPKTEAVPGTVAAAFDRYRESQRLLSARAMLDYAGALHPEGVREFHRILSAALNQLAEEGALDEGHPVARLFLDMVKKPPVAFYAAYNDAAYRALPRFTTRHFVLGGVKSPDGLWLVLRQENALEGSSRSFLVKAHMKKFEGQWRQDIGAELGPERAATATVVRMLKRFVEQGAQQEAIEAIDEARQGAAEDEASYQCDPGEKYLLRVVAASRSEAEGYVPKVFVTDAGKEKVYVDVRDMGICDGLVRTVTRRAGVSHELSVGLTASGRHAFERFTERLRRRPVAFLVKGEITSLPVVAEVIHGRTLTVTLPAGWSEAEIQQYIDELEGASSVLRGVD